MRTNYVLIDYENVQPDVADVLALEHYQLMVFVGANQAKISFEVASVVQRLGQRAQYIKISGNGTNALDFHIAYYIGKLVSRQPSDVAGCAPPSDQSARRRLRPRLDVWARTATPRFDSRASADRHLMVDTTLATQDAQAYFHIISKDTGFDPLVAHLKEQKVFAHRSRTVLEIPAIQALKAKSSPERVDAIITNLMSRGQSKPRTTKTLGSTINALFQKQLSDGEIASLIQQLRERHVVNGEDNKLSYIFPEAATKE